MNMEEEFFSLQHLPNIWCLRFFKVRPNMKYCWRTTWLTNGQWPYDTITKTYQEPQNMNSSHTTWTVFAILATILIKFQFLTVAALMNCDDFWQSAEHVLMDGRPLLAMASVTASSSRLLPPGNLQQIHFERFDPFLTFLFSGIFQASSASYCVDIFQIDL